MSLKLAKVARASAPAKAAKANDLPNPTCPPCKTSSSFLGFGYVTLNGCSRTKPGFRCPQYSITFSTVWRLMRASGASALVTDVQAGKRMHMCIHTRVHRKRAETLG